MIKEDDVQGFDMSEEDISIVLKFKSLLFALRDVIDFKGCIFEFSNKTFIVFKVKDSFLVSPVESGNVGSIFYRVEKFLEGIE
jgi:hypothetical protein